MRPFQLFRQGWSPTSPFDKLRTQSQSRGGRASASSGRRRQPTCPSLGGLGILSLSNGEVRFHRARAAFTLIEVLVALAIFALAAVVLGAAYVNVLTSYDTVSRRSEHEQELRLVRALILAEPDLAEVEKGGDFALPDHRNARWTATVEPAAVADLFRVTFRCEFPEPGRAEPWVRTEVFQVLRPTWSDPAERERLRQQSRQQLEKRDRP